MAVARVPEFTPAGVVADARARITDLVDTLWGVRLDGDLIGVVEELQALKSAIAAVEAGAVAEVEARGIAKTVLHYGSTADWLTHLGGLRRALVAATSHPSRRRGSWPPSTHSRRTRHYAARVRP